MSTALPASARVRVTTPSRLHLGIFNLPDGGYGGIGVAIDRPNVCLTAEHADRVTAAGQQAVRALQAAEALCARYHVQRGAAIRVEAAITPHAGLGSGTQIALATVATLARLWAIDRPLPELAEVAGRAARSRIGLEAFRHGGFVAHATWRSGETSTRLRRFPAAWRFVVAVPEEEQGLSGEAESRAFAELPPMPLPAQRAARDLAELEILPALEQSDLVRFGQGLTGLQAIVGDYFAPAQGGRYAHPLGAPLAEHLLHAGAAGAGQSSWGPAICGVVGSEAEADRVRQSVHRRFPGVKLHTWTTAADNQGSCWEWEGL